MKYLTKQGGVFLVRVAVPQPLWGLIGRKELLESTGTGDLKIAIRMRDPIVLKFKQRISDARAGLAPRAVPTAAQREADLRDTLHRARIALAAWVAHEQRRGHLDEGGIHPASETLNRIELLTRAWNERDGYRSIEGFDETLAAILTLHGCRIASSDPAISALRQEAALTFLFAAQEAERGRQLNALGRLKTTISETPIEAVVVVGAKEEKPLPSPSIRLSVLFSDWVEFVKPRPKTRQRMEHQFRRIVEFMGDRPANHVNKRDIIEFMALVARFPVLKGPERSLPIQEFVEHGERVGAKTLTKESVTEWFSSYSRAFDWAVLKDDLEANPWAGIGKHVIKGAKSVERRAFSDDEIKRIFTSPLFTGSTSAGGYRNIPGSQIVKDHKYWLPILGIFEGGRLNEIAASPLSDIKQSAAGTWYFDLLVRDVKNRPSQREIPIHPKVIDLGFLDYVEEQRRRGQEWLFPLLNHKSPHGPAHNFSKWWARWMDDAGLNDPAITYHSWRHTWKRHARASDVKEEIHDVLSGHAAIAVSRKYGEGAPIDVLGDQMQRITFPVFPL
jgi:integrase